MIYLRVLDMAASVAASSKIVSLGSAMSSGPSSRIRNAFTVSRRPDKLLFGVLDDVLLPLKQVPHPILESLRVVHACLLSDSCDSGFRLAIRIGDCYSP